MQTYSRKASTHDEIQDYTQAEVALFFMLCDHGVFLRKATAQRGVEGAEFV
jgi:hypothetical protein